VYHLVADSHLPEMSSDLPCKKETRFSDKKNTMLLLHNCGFQVDYSFYLKEEKKCSVWILGEFLVQNIFN